MCAPGVTDVPIEKRIVSDGGKKKRFYLYNNLGNVVRRRRRGLWRRLVVCLLFVPCDRLGSSNEGRKQRTTKFSGRRRDRRPHRNPSIVVYDEIRPKNTVFLLFFFFFCYFILYRHWRGSDASMIYNVVRVGKRIFSRKKKIPLYSYILFPMYFSRRLLNTNTHYDWHFYILRISNI